MNSEHKILLIDDRIDDSKWLVHDLEARGYTVDQFTNEKEGLAKLNEVKSALNEGKRPYRLAIIDIMIPIMDIMEMAKVDEDFFEYSLNTGIRLCWYARRELRITEQELPIVSLTARSDDEELREQLGELGVPLFSRVPQNEDEDIRAYLDNVFSTAA